MLHPMIHHAQNHTAQQSAPMYVYIYGGSLKLGYPQIIHSSGFFSLLMENKDINHPSWAYHISGNPYMRIYIMYLDI